MSFTPQPSSINPYDPFAKDYSTGLTAVASALSSSVTLTALNSTIVTELVNLYYPTSTPPC